MVVHISYLINPETAGTSEKSGLAEDKSAHRLRIVVRVGSEGRLREPGKTGDNGLALSAMVDELSERLEKQRSQF